MIKSRARPPGLPPRPPPIRTAPPHPRRATPFPQAVAAIVENLLAGPHVRQAGAGAGSPHRRSPQAARKPPAGSRVGARTPGVRLAAGVADRLPPGLDVVVAEASGSPVAVVVVAALLPLPLSQIPVQLLPGRTERQGLRSPMRLMAFASRKTGRISTEVPILRGLHQMPKWPSERLSNLSCTTTRGLPRSPATAHLQPTCAQPPAAAPPPPTTAPPPAEAPISQLPPPPPADAGAAPSAAPPKASTTLANRTVIERLIFTGISSWARISGVTLINFRFPPYSCTADRPTGERGR